MRPYNFLYEEIRSKLKKIIMDNSLFTINIMSGMDIGVQQLGMLAAVNLVQDKTIDSRTRKMIKTTAVLPCENCDIKWPSSVRRIYYDILNKVDNVETSKYPYNNLGEIVYQIRDDHIVNKADTVIGVYNNVESTRTLHALRYAAIKGKNIIRINPNAIKNKSERELKVILNDLPELGF